MFLLGGNTYVYQVVSADATDIVVELAGVTGVTAVNDTAATNNIFIG